MPALYIFDLIQTLKQVFFLTMMTLFVIDVFYQLTFVEYSLVYFELYDILLCLFCISLIRLDNFKAWILVITLLPVDSLAFVFLGYESFWMIIPIFIHLLGLAYGIVYFYREFVTYTKSNGLRYTILLLFVIIFISFIWTAFVENVNLLDSLVMVSNAFTSNGYSILGKSLLGKINEIFLVWSGYILSGVATATLTAALISRHFNKRFDKLQESIEELKEKLKEEKDNKY